MTAKRDVLEICCKILGLMCLVHGVTLLAPAIATLAGWIKGSEEVPWSFGIPLMSGVQFAVAFVLIKHSKRIASLLMREDAAIQIAVGEGWERPVYSLSMRIVGAVMLIKGIPQLVSVLVQLGLYHHHSARNVGPHIWGQLVGAVVHLVLGVYFIGGAPLIVKIALKGSMRESASDNNEPAVPA